MLTEDKAKTNTQVKMRGILTHEKIREMRADADERLAALFTTPKGRVGASRIERIPARVAEQLFYNLLDVVNDGQMLYGFNHVMLTTWVDAAGKRTSRQVTAVLKKAGINTDSKKFQEWMATWTSHFMSTDAEYQIRWDIEAFDMIGEIPGVDGRVGGTNKSCYRKQGEYREAPVTLACGFGQGVPTFVVLLYKKDTVVGRAWGFIPTAPFMDCVFLSNGYYGTGVASDINVMVRAVEAACHRPMTVRKYNWETDRSQINWPLFVNRDTTLAWPTAQTPPVVGYEHVPDLRATKCLACSGRITVLGQGQHPFCGACMDGTEPCCVCGMGVSPRHAYHGCGHCANDLIYCQTCYATKHQSCSQCGEQSCRPRQEVYVQAYATSVRRIIQVCDNCMSIDSSAWKCTTCQCTYRAYMQPDKVCLACQGMVQVACKQCAAMHMKKTSVDGRCRPCWDKMQIEEEKKFRQRVVQTKTGRTVNYTDKWQPFAATNTNMYWEPPVQAQAQAQTINPAPPPNPVAQFVAQPVGEEEDDD